LVLPIGHHANGVENLPKQIWGCEGREKKGISGYGKRLNRLKKLKWVNQAE